MFRNNRLDRIESVLETLTGQQAELTGSQNNLQGSVSELRGYVERVVSMFELILPEIKEMQS